MPIKFIDDPEEFARITGGYRGSVYIGPAPPKKPKPKPKRPGFIFPGEEGCDSGGPKWGLTMRPPSEPKPTTPPEIEENKP